MKRALIVLFTFIALGMGAMYLLRPTDSVVLPQPQSTVVPVRPDAKTYTLLFAGDIMLDRSVKNRIVEAQDPLFPFVRIADVTRAADIAFANLEGPVSQRGTNQGSQYSFRFEPVGTMNALAFAGFDVVSIANNHIWDWGKDALVDTITHLDDAGIGHVGAGRNADEAGRPFVAQLDDTKVALFGYTDLYPKNLEAGTDSPGIGSFAVSSTIERARNMKESGGADIVIVSLHWGVEYATSSNEYQQGIARALIDGGVDLVIGHHPHVVQEVEAYKDGWIVYSLGNFVFDQFFSEETMSGLMVEARIQNKKIEGIKEIPIRLTPTFQPYIVGAPGDPGLDVVE